MHAFRYICIISVASTIFLMSLLFGDRDLSATPISPNAPGRDPSNFEPRTAAAIASRITAPLQNDRQGGRVYRINVVPSTGGATGNVNAYVIPAGSSNAFYIVDSPVPLTFKSSQAGETEYVCQTGQSFPGALNDLQLTATSSVELAFVAKVWVGPMNWIGFIDNRTQPATNNLTQQFGGPQTATYLGVAINAAANAQAIAITPAGGPQYMLSELLISNQDANSTIYLCDSTGGVIYEPIFPRTTIRVPIPDYLPPDLGGLVYIKNPGGTIVTANVTPINMTNSAFIEEAP